MFKVTKRIEWDSAHRLVKGYDGLCANNHGHHYAAEITVQSEVFNQYDFVIDFKMFKEIKKWIDEKWDHATLLNDEDDNFRTFLEDNKQRLNLFVTGKNPTAENMAKRLHDVACHIFADCEVKVVCVKVFETPTSWAEYSE